MKEFAKYLKTVSFDEALHHARQLNRERVIANEQTLETVHHGVPQPQPKTNKAAAA